jgi:hypothetical protein
VVAVVKLEATRQRRASPIDHEPLLSLLLPLAFHDFRGMLFENAD